MVSVVATNDKALVYSYRCGQKLAFASSKLTLRSKKKFKLGYSFWMERDIVCVDCCFSELEL